MFRNLFLGFLPLLPFFFRSSSLAVFLYGNSTLACKRAIYISYTSRSQRQTRVLLVSFAVFLLCSTYQPIQPMRRRHTRTHSFYLLPRTGARLRRFFGVFGAPPPSSAVSSADVVCHITMRRLFFMSQALVVLKIGFFLFCFRFFLGGTYVSFVVCACACVFIFAAFSFLCVCVSAITSAGSSPFLSFFF
jgi:hypothetical protein